MLLLKWFEMKMNVGIGIVRFVLPSSHADNQRRMPFQNIWPANAGTQIASVYTQFTFSRSVLPCNNTVKMTSWILMHSSTGKCAFYACNILRILLFSHQVSDDFVSQIHMYCNGVGTKYCTTIWVYCMNFKNRGHTTHKKSFAIRRIKVTMLAVFLLLMKKSNFKESWQLYNSKLVDGI